MRHGKFKGKGTGTRVQQLLWAKNGTQWFVQTLAHDWLEWVVLSQYAHVVGALDTHVRLKEMSRHI